MKRNSIPRRTRSELNKFGFNTSPLSFLPKEKLSPEENMLKQAALMLYWAEGSKRHNRTVDFANSDPEMIALFTKCLREIYQVSQSRLRVYLYCYATQSVPELLEYWSELTHIPLSQFTKPYVRQDSTLNHHAMRYGLVHIRYSDQRLFQLIEQDRREIIEKCRVSQVVNDG